MYNKWSKRQKKLLWHYFQVLRSLGPTLKKKVTMEYKYATAAEKVDYSVQYAGRLIAKMEKDEDLVRHVDSCGSIEDIL